MSKTPETILIPYAEANEEDFRPPSKWYIRTAMGDLLFVKCRDRIRAQEVIDEEFGKNKYRIRTC